MSEKVEATPGPWQYVPKHPNYCDSRFMIWGPDGPGHGIVAHTSPYGIVAEGERAANAEFIVRAANAHAALLAACKATRETLLNARIELLLADSLAHPAPAWVRLLAEKLTAQVTALTAAIRLAEGGGA